MFQFIEFLRVVAVGGLALGLFGVIFLKSVFSLSLPIFFMISTLFGLLIQPFLRAYHPYRKEVKAVIKHVENYIREVLLIRKKDCKGCESNELENALARAIYEYLYRTVEYSPFFTSRVNEQIRFFYFYYFAGLSLRLGALCSIFALLLRLFYEYTPLSYFKFLKFIEKEFLFGIGNIICTAVIVIIFALIAYLLSFRFNSTAKGIIYTELYTRHVFIMSEREKIQELAKQAQKDETLMEVFKQRIDKEKGIFPKRK